MVLIQLVRGPGRESTGQVLRVSRLAAEGWVAQGIAVYVPEPETETTMAEPPETAMLPRARARRVVSQ